MSYICLDYVCEECGHHEMPIFRRDSLPAPDYLDCGECGEENGQKRRMSAPTPLRQSYHQGYKRGGDWQLFKEAAKLESKAANLPHDQRGEIKQEIKKLKKASTKEKPKDRK